jgi:hypothetical protein
MRYKAMSQRDDFVQLERGLTERSFLRVWQTQYPSVRSGQSYPVHKHRLRVHLFRMNRRGNQLAYTRQGCTIISQGPHPHREKRGPYKVNSSGGNSANSPEKDNRSGTNLRGWRRQRFTSAAEVEGPQI